MLTGIRRHSRMGEQPADVIELLFASHDRTRRLMQVAARMPDSVGARPAEIKKTASALARYFRHDVRLHSADEELSLRPRLHEALIVDEVREAMHTMREQHLAMAAELSQLIPIWESVGDCADRWVQVAEPMRRATARLSALVHCHLALEEETIFPAVRRYLSDDSEAVILREMRTRRRSRATTVPLAVDSM
jgi:hemerythrin-like domain-containing protein